MSEEIFQIPAEISSIKSMARRGLRITCDSNEGLSDEQMAKAMALHEKRGWLTVSVEPVTPDDLLKLPPLTFDKEEKSPSTRLRGVIYVRWDQAGKPMESFEVYYRSVMEKLIDQFKEKLT